MNVWTLKHGNDLKVNSIKGSILQDIIDQIIGEQIIRFINLKLIGGEQLVMKQYYQLLDAIIKTGHASVI